MESEVNQLVEMGATAAQARAALKRYKDVMQAAERIFEGAFDDVVDEDGDAQMSGVGTSTSGRDVKLSGLATPDEDEDGPADSGDMAEDDDEDDDGDEDDYVDYDSDEGVKVTNESSRAVSDPYAGIFFSKDRREEVIEVEEPLEIYHIPGTNANLKLMPQGQWMKGCPEGGEQNYLFGLYNQLSYEPCLCPHGCGTTVARKKADFFALYPTFAEYIEHVRDVIRAKCRTCSKDFCLACGEPFNHEKVRRSALSNEDIDLLHCSNIQGVTLGIGLAMLEQLYHDQLNEVSTSSDEASRTSKKRKVTPTVSLPPNLDFDDEDDAYPLPVGVVKKSKGGIGYAGDMKEDTTGQAEALAQQKAKDESLGALMSRIRVYLPNLHRDGGGQASDYLVHPTALAHLRRRFNNICSSLLRNDSLTDMSERSAVYFELFEWLETISKHEALASMMAMPIMVVQSVKTTPKKATNGTPPPREKAVVYEGSAGPRELLEAIVIQAQAAIKGLEGAKQAELEPTEMTEEQKRVTNDTKGKTKEILAVTLSEENEKLFSFCNRILATANAIDRALREVKGDNFVKRLHDSLPRIHRASEDKSEEVYVEADATDEATQKAYVEWANRVRFEYCDLSIPSPESDIRRSSDEPPNYKFYFNNEARMLASADIPKRSLAIAKELAVLTTNLPVAWDSSIFLRVDESRVDIIKALIIGPEGTPYQNGCYLFDIFLGSSYNQSPPSVKYMTTNGGKYRFNPNLYADGKVCLSLLGTWQGPGWVAGKSTLLQVLISIQSMILCDEPYLNEPGWANAAGTAPSIAYSANVRRMVVRTAMLGNIRNPPEPFGDVIRTHFRLKARSITAQLDKWLAQDDGKLTIADGAASARGPAGASSAAFQADIDEMKRVLQGLQNEKMGDTSA